ncbi:MAG: hypothetical protein AAFX50_20230, partial [Acidobacteriota bacterium]
QLEVSYRAQQSFREFTTCRSAMIAPRIARQIVGEERWAIFCRDVEERLAFEFVEPLQYDVGVNFTLAINSTLAGG